MEKKVKIWTSLEITKIVIGIVVAASVAFYSMNSQQKGEQSRLYHQDSLDRARSLHQDSLDRERRFTQDTHDSLQIAHKDSLDRVNRNFSLLLMEKQLSKQNEIIINSSKKQALLKALQEVYSNFHDIKCFLGFGFEGCSNISFDEYRKSKRSLELLVEPVPSFIGFDLGSKVLMYVSSAGLYEECLLQKLNNDDTLPNLQPPQTKSQLALKLMKDDLELQTAIFKKYSELNGLTYINVENH